MISLLVLTGDIKHNPDADLLIMTPKFCKNCFKMSNADKNAVNYLDFNIDLQTIVALYLMKALYR